jgi:hypothetical protein
MPEALRVLPLLAGAAPRTGLPPALGRLEPSEVDPLES